ncbi:RrF2 family transcriptional regulator [Amycolatopsis thermophila]|uniref:Rrf2 family protein n=1 Tax=Amycolatopsis thermophila TaxID=206084 RepID=A0ABU0ENW9_9PSEU|nr:Rrf2 family transcriptional regulator [Amycolatopsis thermophila]MDQ0376991.1 Rrf2 family protein [Amycolatopsis thermophila]
MGEGVEWGLHCCLVLAWLDDLAPLPAGRLAEVFDLPPEYLKKRLQPLVKAGILSSDAGARGGYRLARDPAGITLMDVVVAIEGGLEPFQCQEVRQRGAGATASADEFRRPCGILTAFRKAELAWRRELAAQTLADLLAATPKTAQQRARRFVERV